MASVYTYFILIYCGRLIGARPDDIHVNNLKVEMDKPDPQLLKLGKHMFLPELLTEIVAIASHTHTNPPVKLCGREDEALVDRCGIKYLLQVFFPPGQIGSPLAQDGKQSNAGSSKVIKDLCNFYEEFNQCIESLGYPKRCTPLYLSTVRAMAGYSCGNGKTALTESLECITTKLTSIAVTRVITTHPGCKAAIPRTLMLTVLEAWEDVVAEFSTIERVPVLSIMSMVCKQWSLYNKCYLPTYAIQCGDVTRGYFEGLHNSTVGFVTSVLHSMGPEYVHLAECKDDSKLVYDALAVMDFVYQPFFNNWEQDFARNVKLSGDRYGVCSSVTILARFKYCQVLALQRSPPLPAYTKMNTFGEIGQWICERLGEEFAMCWMSLLHGCQGEKLLPLAQLTQNICGAIQLIKSDPHIFCFSWDIVSSDPKMDFLAQCNLTLDSSIDVLSYLITHYPHLNFCNKKMHDMVYRVLERAKCLLQKLAILPKKFPNHCGKEMIGYWMEIVKYGVVYMDGFIALDKSSRNEVCKNT